jgi:periplasmic protein TonB
MRVLLFAFMATIASTAALADQLKPLFTFDDYPAEAVRNKWQGDVTVTLTIGLVGRATECKIVKSSGYKVLDDATCKIFLERAKFVPKIGPNGTPVAFQWTPAPIGWHLYP